MNRIAIKTSDIDELFSEDDPYDGFSKYEEISRGRMRFNVPTTARPVTTNYNLKPKINDNFNASTNHVYPPSPSSSPPRPFSKFSKRQEIDEDDGNSADNEKSVHIFSSLRPPLSPSRSPFHHPPPYSSRNSSFNSNSVSHSLSHSNYSRERKEDDENEIFDLLAAAPPSAFSNSKNSLFTNDNDIDSPDDLKSISLVLQEKYIPPKLLQEIDPAVDDFIQFQDYIPPPSIEKKKDNLSFPTTTRSSISSSSSSILSPSSSLLSKHSHSSPTPKKIQTPKYKHDKTKLSNSRASGSESLNDGSVISSRSNLSDSFDNVSFSSSRMSALKDSQQAKSPKKLRFTGDAAPVGELSQLDDEYNRLKKRELEKMHQDLLDFSYFLEERDIEIKNREAEVQQRLQEFKLAENEEREKDDELSYLREHEKKTRDEIKQLRTKNIELQRQINNLHTSNTELTQKLNLADTRLKNFKDALTTTKEKNTELQRQNDELRQKKSEIPHNPIPRAPVESASATLVHETLVALVCSICSLSNAQHETTNINEKDRSWGSAGGDFPMFGNFVLPSQLSVSLLGKLLPYVASKKDNKFQSSYLHLLFIVLRQESYGTSNKYARLLPDLRSFEQSHDRETLFFANLVAIVISSNSTSLSDVTARALVALQGCVATEEGKEQFMKTDPMNTLLPLMRSKNRAILIPLVTLLLSMCSEGEFLPEFLRRCSNEEWFSAAAVGLRSDVPDVVDHLCVILEKLSKISSNRGIFTRTGIRPILSAILLKNPGPFTQMNIVSTLKAAEKDD